MTKSIREEREPVYSIGASSEPAVVYPGFGLFAAFAPTEPAKAPALSTAIEDMFTDFAKDGPTPDELAVAKRQVANQLDETLKMPSFWLGRLSTLDYRGLGIDDVLDAPNQYQRFTAKEIQEAFARYDQPEARFRFDHPALIAPRGAAAGRADRAGCGGSPRSSPGPAPGGSRETWAEAERRSR